MSVSTTMRRGIKGLLRPALLPLLRRFRLPFAVMLPRIEHIEREIDAMHPALARCEKRMMEMQAAGMRDPALLSRVDDLGMTVAGLRESAETLTRTWLRLQNDLARLSASVPETAQATADARIAQFEARVATWEARAEGMASVAAEMVRGEIVQLSSRLDGVARQQRDEDAARAARVDDTLRFLLDRVEFVRREMMFELRYGSGGENTGAAGGPAPAAPGRVAPRILSVEKVEAARSAGSLRLNLGCGHIAERNYINVDMRELPGVDVIAEAGALPFEPGSVDEIASAHLMEHFPQEDTRRRLLPHWRKLLKPGGVLRAVTPDGEAMLAGITQGSYSFEDFREVLFGGQDYAGDFHYNLFTPDSLGRLVQEAGFTEPQFPVRGRRNGACFEFELIARVPAETSSQ